MSNVTSYDNRDALSLECPVPLNDAAEFDDSQPEEPCPNDPDGLHSICCGCEA